MDSDQAHHKTGTRGHREHRRRRSQEASVLGDGGGRRLQAGVSPPTSSLCSIDYHRGVSSSLTQAEGDGMLPLHSCLSFGKTTSPVNSMLIPTVSPPSCSQSPLAHDSHVQEAGSHEHSAFHFPVTQPCWTSKLHSCV